jgi:hypothetical protein
MPHNYLGAHGFSRQILKKKEGLNSKENVWLTALQPTSFCQVRSKIIEVQDMSYLYFPFKRGGWVFSDT